MTCPYRGRILYVVVLLWELLQTTSTTHLLFTLSTQTRFQKKDISQLKYWMRVLVAQSCLALCNPMDRSPPGSSVHGTLQARVLEWGDIAFSDHLTFFLPIFTIIVLSHFWAQFPNRNAGHIYSTPNSYTWVTVFSPNPSMTAAGMNAKFSAIK